MSKTKRRPTARAAKKAYMNVPAPKAKPAADAPKPPSFRGPAMGSGEPPPAKGTCAVCEDVECTDGDYCFGCRAYVCSKHGDSPWGAHEITDHTTEPDDED